MGPATTSAMVASTLAYMERAMTTEIMSEDLRDDVTRANGFKEHLVSNSETGDADVPPQLFVRRDGRLLCIIFCKQVDRDEGLQAAQLAVPGFAADEITIALDAHGAGQAWMDRMGRHPDPGELQHVCDNEGFCELGLTTDTIYTIRMCRDGTLDVVDSPYHVNKTAKQVHWQEQRFMPSVQDNFVGIVPDGLKACFEIPLASDALTREAEKRGMERRDLVALFDPSLVEATDEEIRFHEDMAILQIMARAGFMVMWATRSKEEEEIVGNSMRAAGLGGTTSDGVEIEEPSLDEMTERQLEGTLMAVALQTRLRDEREASYAADKAEAARRRAQRAYDAAKAGVHEREQRSAATAKSKRKAANASRKKNRKR